MHLWGKGAKISLNKNAFCPAGLTETVKGASHSLYSHSIQDVLCCKKLLYFWRTLHTKCSHFNLEVCSGSHFFFFKPVTTGVFARLLMWKQSLSKTNTIRVTVANAAPLLRLSRNSLPELTKASAKSYSIHSTRRVVKWWGVRRAHSEKSVDPCTSIWKKKAYRNS